jgi:hypothetical protein
MQWWYEERTPVLQAASVGVPPICDGVHGTVQDLDQYMFAGFMIGSCVQACNLCFPTLPAAELQRRQVTESFELDIDSARGEHQPAVHVMGASPHAHVLKDNNALQHVW